MRILAILTSMPITASAKKALRQNRTNRARNAKRKDAYKKAVTTYRKLAASKKMDEAKAALVTAYRALDKAARSNVMKKNKADRLKSRLAKLIGR